MSQQHNANNPNRRPHQESASGAPRKKPLKKGRRANTGCLSGLLYFLFVVGVSALLAGFGWVSANEVLALSKPENSVVFEVKEGFTIGELAEDLKEENIIAYTWLFKLYANITNAEEKIDPGTYELKTNLDYMAIVHSMNKRSSSRSTVRVTIPEGYTLGEIFDALAEKGVCTVEALRDTAQKHKFSHEFLKELPQTANRLEGYLFPDTYDFYINENPVDALSKMLNNFDRKLTADMRARAADMNLSLHEIVTIASMIEREAANADEGPLIASVIYNRLHSDKFPYLQIDATILYALPTHKTALTDADKELDSPYNTYQKEGLPPGPIASPGKSSLMAALDPEDTEYYYYAINKEGEHQFSKTLKEHEQVVAEAKAAGLY